MQGTLIFCRGRVVGRGGPLGGRCYEAGGGSRRFHGPGKRVAQGGGVYEHRREPERERERRGVYSWIEKPEGEGESVRREKRRRTYPSCFRTHTFNHVPAFSELSAGAFASSAVILTSGRRDVPPGKKSAHAPPPTDPPALACPWEKVEKRGRNFPARPTRWEAERTRLRNHATDK